MNIITSVRGSEVNSNLEFKKFIEALGVKFMKFNLAIQYKDKFATELAHILYTYKRHSISGHIENTRFVCSRFKAMPS